MKTIFNSTWVGNHICTEEATLSQLDGYNKTRYSRRKNKEGLLEQASREAHEQQNVYFATILNEDDSPFAKRMSNKMFTLQRFSMRMTAPTAPLSPMWDTLVWIS